MAALVSAAAQHQLCLTVSHNQQAAFMAVFLEILNNLLVLSKPMNTSVKTDKAIPFLQCDFS